MLGLFFSGLTVAKCLAALEERGEEEGKSVVVERNGITQRPADDPGVERPLVLLMLQQQWLMKDIKDVGQT
jgi:hypothetical protein